ncbi:hypothetical protein JCGZ_22360 [Jatropha curcas]|uniref:DUF241 domain-containing protein n=1 Tax=Jatropha curcas TaxID=180498 RepID=A0A067L958_JATCU|nr:uncharacterized protein LOC105628608 [Jatropha curcas]KDP43733.1 hypothetical protein JCGZ_22360 [Jatropha curcas]
MDSSHVPVRSISLPSRLHPSSLKIEAELTKLKSWELLSSSSTTTTSRLGGETIQIALTKLAELFICIEELTNSPQSKKALHHQNLNQVEQVLEGSVGLIDVCSTSRDMFLAMQEHVRDLQSVLRRKGKDLSIESNMQDYISFRKSAKKEVSKLLSTLKKLENNDLPSSIPKEDNHLSYLVKMIREVQAIAIVIFRFVILFLSPHSMKTSSSGWSMVSKLVHLGFVDSDKGEKIFNEVGRVDISLCSILGKIKKNTDAKFDLQEMQEKLEILAISIQDLEDKLDCVFRCLIQNRVSLLNLVTP